MVLELLALAGIPTAISTTLGTNEAIRSEDTKEKEKKLTTECHLYAYCEADSRKRDQVHGKQVVLRDNKVFLEDKSSKGFQGLPFSGFYVTYPNDAKPMGLVSMISHDPPAMGWLYVDKVTFELKYGNRTSSIEHIVGPWDFTEDELGVTLAGEELFVAVEEKDNQWALYYDRNDDGTGLPKKKRVLEVSLERKPK
ncbi:MAG: hypothetical protein M1837_001878 [Sclerophora amabilis]|nr:MAG: hypothetical protein M1837_001878 [Sclerophora amabilis]